MPTDNWFYSRAGQQHGPVTDVALKQLAATGQLQRTDLVWTEGMAEWAAAGSRPELFEAAAPQPIAYAAPAAALNYYDASHAVVYAGFWLRVAAYIIDYIVLWIPTVILQVALSGVFGLSQMGPLHLHQTNLAVGSWSPSFDELPFLKLVIGWVYFALMESSPMQATLGKMACGIIVMDESGAPIGFGRATGRYFGKILSAIILCIGFMMAGWTQKKQALHDILANTLVVAKRR